MLHFRAAAATPADLEAFTALSNSLYARKVTPAYARWQFFEPPHPTYLTFACDGDRVIGAYGLHQIGGHHGLPALALSLDIMIAADYQGRGLIKPLVEAAYARLDPTEAAQPCSIANPRAHAALARHYGWNLWQTLVDWDWTGSTALLPLLPPDLVAKPIAAPDAAFLARVAQSDLGPTLYRRDAATLRWRLVENQRYKYQWFEIAPLGFFVAKSFTDPTTGACYLDILETFPRAPVDETGLLQAALAILTHSQNNATVSLYPSRPALLEAAKSLGFKPSSRERFWIGDGAPPPGLGVGKLDVDVF